jgi:hypothetical protein
MTERDDLKAATERYRALKSQWDEVQRATVDAVIAALKADISPTEVTALSPYTAAYVRKLARAAGVPAALPGPKPRKTT